MDYAWVHVGARLAEVSRGRMSKSRAIRGSGEQRQGEQRQGEQRRVSRGEQRQR
jgi:hypothetical protein